MLNNQYRLEENMYVEDLILQAGGFELGSIKRN